MSLSDIANKAALKASGKEKEEPLLQSAKSAFNDPGFRKIEDHLRLSGFAVERKFMSDSSFAADTHGIVAFSAGDVTFSKNDVWCKVSTFQLAGRKPDFYFERSDTRRIAGRESEARVEIENPAASYPLIQDFIMDNLQIITQQTIGGYFKSWVPSSLKR